MYNVLQPIVDLTKANIETFSRFANSREVTELAPSVRHRPNAGQRPWSGDRLGSDRLTGRCARAFAVLVVTVGILVGLSVAPLARSASAAVSQLQTDVNALKTAGNVGVLAETRVNGVFTAARAGSPARYHSSRAGRSLQDG